MTDSSSQMTELVEQATALAGIPARPPSASPALRDPAVWDLVGDPIAEAFLDDVRAHRMTRLDVVDAAYVLRDQGVASATDFLADVEAVPSWVDFDAMRPGARMGARNVLGFALGLDAGLPLTYIDGQVATTFELTGRLSEHGDYGRRVWETATGFVAALDVDQMRPGGDEWARWVRIRVMHTRVRVGLLQSGKWDLDSGSVPISAAGTAGGIFITGTYRARICQAFGYASEAEVDSWTMMWQWIARILGAPPELIATSPQGQAAIDVATGRHLFRPNDVSRRLMQANLDGLSQMRPFSLLPRGLHAALAHYLLDERWLQTPTTTLDDMEPQSRDDYEELRQALGTLRPDLSLTAHPNWRIVVAVLAPATRLMGRIQATTPGVRQLTASIGLRSLRNTVQRGLGSHDADYSTHVDAGEHAPTAA